MHNFEELVENCAAFTMHTLSESNEKTIEALSTSGATSLVKTLQMIELQKAILAVGMFSLFEASLQDNLNCQDGFDGAKKILLAANETALLESFNDFCLAINVLKHGRGRSYDALVERAKTGLPFAIKMPEQAFFYEGDVGEISTLVRVDESFIQRCAEIIRSTYATVRKANIVPR